MSITVERMAENSLEKRVWIFNPVIKGDKLKIILNRYEQQTRPTKRHKFKVSGKVYESFRPYSGLLRKDVHIPADVALEAFNWVVNSYVEDIL
ncbi:hypothetical protein [Paenibacillus polymyxa]|uniref:Phage protein n=1 Tax=Paenibacillus polymyxa TaxID=1406 RepID=A0ABX2ZDR5_PAEPO|nr:hypothetical protein [Paenibacillus polymyxa]ODA08709.1 hypothetical protein A7312_04715 [Paenibacillus polymyxa]